MKWDSEHFQAIDDSNFKQGPQLNEKIVRALIASAQSSFVPHDEKKKIVDAKVAELREDQ